MSALYEALLAVQAELPKVQKTKINPHFKSRFMGLEDVAEAAMPLLTAQGLVWTTMPCTVDGTPSLRYTLTHAETGEQITETMSLLTKNDPQGQGSGITYARRYALTAVLNIVADEDDDGNRASRPPAAHIAPPVTTPPASPERATLNKELTTIAQAAVTANAISKTDLLAALRKAGATPAASIGEQIASLSDKGTWDLRAALDNAIDTAAA